MSDALKQVDIRLKLVDREPLYSSQKITTPEDAVQILADILKELDREEVCVVNLDGANHPINFNIISVGSSNASFALPREVYKSSILSNANSILVLHNHPSSDVQVSREDILATKQMIEAGNLLGIRLMDHIIVGGRTGEIFSFQEYFTNLFQKEVQYRVAEDKPIYGKMQEEKTEPERRHHGTVKRR